MVWKTQETFFEVKSLLADPEDSTNVHDVVIISGENFIGYLSQLKNVL